MIRGIWKRQVGASYDSFSVDLATLTANTSPNHLGMPNCIKLMEDSSTGFHSITLLQPGQITGRKYRYIAKIKADGRNAIMGNHNTAVFINLSNGTFGAEYGSVPDKTITPLSNGFYRVEIDYTNPDAGIATNMTIGTASTVASGGEEYAGNGTSGIIFAEVPYVVDVTFTETPTGGSGVTLIMDRDFEEATNTFAGMNVEQTTGGVTRSTAVSRTGTASVRFYINKADLGYGGQPDSPHRAEIHSNVEEFEFNTDYWIGFSQYYQNYTTSDPASEGIWQWHNTPNFGAGETWGTLKLQTPFSCQVQNNKFLIKHAWNSVPSDPNSSVTLVTEDVGSVVSNTWVDWVIHARFHYSTGLIEVWKDGVLVYTKTGNTYYNDETGPYHKLGIYKWSWVHPEDNSVVTERTMFTDNWRIATGSTITYNDFVSA